MLDLRFERYLYISGNVFEYHKGYAWGILWFHELFEPAKGETIGRTVVSESS
jgi:hypothetical protein